MIRRCIERSGIAIALTLAILPAAAAQGPRVSEPLAAGQVIRLHLVDGSLAAARLLEPYGPDSATFVYCPYGTAFCSPGPNQHRVVMQASEVRQVDVKRGSQAVRGLLLGAVGSAVLAGAVCLAQESLAHSCQRQDFPRVAALFVPLGAVVGGLVGLSRPRWRPER